MKMNDNRIISLVKSLGLYQIILTGIISLLNISIFFPFYYLSYIESPPFVDLSESKNIKLTDLLCSKNYSINPNTKMNFYLDKNLTFFIIKFPYCEKFSMVSLFLYFSVTNYLFLIFNILFKPRINYILSVICYYSGIIIFLIFIYISDNDLNDLTKNFIIILWIIQVFSSSILSSSLHFVSSLTNKNHRHSLINCVLIIPSNLCFLITTYFYDVNLSQISFFIFMITIPTISIVLIIIFTILSVENPKFFKSTSIELIQDNLKHISKINYFFDEINYTKKIESLNAEIINNEQFNFHNLDIDLLKFPNLLLFTLLYFCNGFIYSITIIELSQKSEFIKYYWYIFISISIILVLLINSFCKDKYFIIIHILFLIQTFIKIFLDNNIILFLFWKLTYDVIMSDIFAKSLSFYFIIADKKRRLINTIFNYCFYHGCIFSYFSYYYFYREVSLSLTSVFSAIIIIIIFYSQKKYKKMLDLNLY